MEWQQKLTATLRQSGIADSSDFCRVIVEQAGENNDQIKSIIEANKGRIFREIKLIQSLVIEIPRSALPELARSNQVKKITHDPPVRHCSGN